MKIHGDRLGVVTVAIAFMVGLAGCNGQDTTGDIPQRTQVTSNPTQNTDNSNPGNETPVAQVTPTATVEPLLGETAFVGTQCQFGSLPDPLPAGLTADSCASQTGAIATSDSPLSPAKIDFTRPLIPLLFQADCRSRTLIIRSTDQSIDTSWDILPNNSFDVEFEGGMLALSTDGAGPCVSYTAIRVTGLVACDKPDQPVISFQLEYHPGQGKVPNQTLHPAPARLCQLPKTCAFLTQAKLLQCI